MQIVHGNNEDLWIMWAGADFWQIEECVIEREYNGGDGMFNHTADI